MVQVRAGQRQRRSGIASASARSSENRAVDAAARDLEWPADSSGFMDSFSNFSSHAGDRALLLWLPVLAGSVVVRSARVDMVICDRQRWGAHVYRTGARFGCGDECRLV